MERISKLVFSVAGWLYRFVIRYLLTVVLFVSAMSVVLNFAIEQIAVGLGHPDSWAMWATLSARHDIAPLHLRLGVYGLLQLNFLLVFAGILRWVTAALADDPDISAYEGEPLELERRRFSWSKLVLNTLYGLGALAFLLPNVTQPTLVDGSYGTKEAMVERAVNLIDGTAVLATRESSVGLYNRVVEPPPLELGEAVTETSFEKTLSLSLREDDLLAQTPGESIVEPDWTQSQPLLDRWDPIIWEAADNDPRKFAQIKALMWVESAGRQFAVSRTGCLGLMQFCSRTARRSPFGEIFGAGQVYTCRCSRTSCAVSRKTMKEMERGDATLVERHAKGYPCDVNDARFNARKSIFAGAKYIANLDEQFGGNIYLIYVGYNSGPAVARRLYDELGSNPDATLDEIRPELVGALEPWHGKKSERRAKGLLNKHLPKVKRAFDRYYKPTDGALIVDTAPPEPEPAPEPIIAELVKPEPTPTPAPEPTPVVKEAVTDEIIEAPSPEPVVIAEAPKPAPAPNPFDDRARRAPEQPAVRRAPSPPARRYGLFDEDAFTVPREATEDPWATTPGGLPVGRSYPPKSLPTVRGAARASAQFEDSQPIFFGF